MKIMWKNMEVRKGGGRMWKDEEKVEGCGRIERRWRNRRK